MQSPTHPRSSQARAIATWAVSLLSVGCGGADITEPEPGDVVVRTETAGAPSDAAGYTIRIEGEDPSPIGANGTVTVAALVAGSRTVELADVPAECTVDGDNPRSVIVPSGGSVQLTFTVTCPLPPGAVTVTTITTGFLPDPDGYTLQVDRAPALPIGINATVVLPQLAPGPHALQLNGVAPNCTVADSNPRTVEVLAGAPLAVEFAVACVVGTLRWTEMTSGTTADLPDVWGSGPADVFTVGEVETTDGGGVASLILHYDGSAWSQQFRQPDLQLRGVWGSAGNDVFAVGFPLLTSGAVVLRYDGIGWAESQRFVSDFEEFSFSEVWGSSATDVFAVGTAFDGEFGRTLIFHYDGRAWQRMAPPASTSPSLNDVWGSSATNVYAVGFDQESDPSTGVVLRYDGAAWAPALQEENLLLNGIWGSSPTDVFATGFTVNDDFEVSGAVVHFDGTKWSHMTLPAVGLLQKVWGSGPTDVYAVGDDGLLLHYDGVSWTETHPTTRTLIGVWGSSPADVFLVGNRGTILHGAP